MKYLIFSFIVALAAGCKSTSDLDVVDNFDADRYMGTWYEAARYPHRFERGMTHVSATYSMNDDGTIKVVNRGFLDAEGRWENIEGVARFKKNSGTGWLKVSFFKPFYASYKVIHLDEQYTEAIVTGPTYSYLWILSRSNVLHEDDLNRLIDIAEKKGFEKDKIIIVSQERKS